MSVAQNFLVGYRFDGRDVSCSALFSKGVAQNFLNEFLVCIRQGCQLLRMS